MEKLPFAIPSDRIIGFTIPSADHFLVCDHDEVWAVSAGTVPTITETELEPYVVAERSDFLGWSNAVGVPVQTLDRAAIAYKFKPKADTIDVHYRVDEIVGKINFPTFSGDWFVASFSREGSLLIVAEPYRLDIYRTSL
jgi:hypothetical protein